MDKHLLKDKYKKYGRYLAKWRLRTARGNAWTSEIKGMIAFASSGGVILLVMDRYFSILVPLWILFVLWFIQKIVEYVMGRIDEKYLKFWQIETEYASRELNPWNAELMDKIDEIRENTKAIKQNVS